MTKAIILAVLVLFSGPAYAAPDHPKAPGVPEVTITTADYSFTAPQEIPAGLVSLTIDNVGKEPHHAQMARLNEGVTPADFQAALQKGLVEADALVSWVGGPSLVDPGTKSTVTLRLEAGTHLLLCFVPDMQGVPHLAHGMVGAIQVVPGESQAAAPTADLTVNLVDFAFAFSEGIPAGTQTWEVVNDGEQIHEIALMKLAEGKTIEDVEHFMHEMQGPPPFANVGGMQAIDPGSSGWLHLDLTPGTYVAICHVPDLATGETHASMGMVMPFVVQ
ncbi:MAG TPA: hypothetical protein VF190_13135 [Rhodothermales bacterium]